MKINICLWPSTEIHLHDLAVNICCMLLDSQKEEDKEHKISVTSNTDQDPEVKNIILGAVANLRHQLVIPPNSIIVNNIKLYDDSPWLTNTPFYKALLKSPDMKIVDYCDSNILWLKSNLGIKAHLMTLAWCQQLANVPQIEFNQKSIDILFYGGINNRRQIFIDHLNKRGLRVTVRNNDLNGEEKLQLIAQSKIVINIHYEDIAMLEWSRIQQLLINGAVVVSEDSVNKDEFRNYADVIYTKLGDPDDMANEIISLLQRPLQMEDQSRRAKEKIRRCKSIFPAGLLLDD